MACTPDKQTFVALVTSDARLARAVLGARPANSPDVHHVEPERIEPAELGRAQQCWLDLDAFEHAAPSEAVLQSLGAARRRVYFYSSPTQARATLPSGLFIRKPCASTVAAILWADVERLPEASATDQQPELCALLAEMHLFDVPALSHVLVTRLAAWLGYRQAALYILDESRGMLTLAQSTFSRPVAGAICLSAPGSSAVTVAMRTGEMTPVEPHANELAALPGERIAPLVADGRAEGLLLLSESAGTAAQASESDLPLTFAARSLRYGGELRRARDEARIDSLTGLRNYRWLTEMLAGEVQRADRFHAPLSALLIDVDSLKSINDTHGHAAGDAALRHVAQVIRTGLRQVDAAARRSGDEFVLVLPGTGAAGARLAAERVARTLRTDPPTFAGAPMHVTLSIGIAEWQPGWCADQLLDAADRAMYAAKPVRRHEPPAIERLVNRPALR